MTDNPLALSKADVLGYTTERPLLFAGYPEYGRPAAYGSPYYSGIEVRPDVGYRILGCRELTFEGVRSTITGQRIVLGEPEDGPWHFDLAPARSDVDP